MPKLRMKGKVIAHVTHVDFEDAGEATDDEGNVTNKLVRVQLSMTSEAFAKLQALSQMHCGFDTEIRAWK